MDSTRLAFERIEPNGQDRAWVPRWMRWLGAAPSFTALGGAEVVATMASFGLAAGAPTTLARRVWSGRDVPLRERLVRGLLRAQRRLATLRGRTVAATPAGHPLLFRGTIRARETLRGAIDQRAGVYHRVLLAPAPRWPRWIDRRRTDDAEALLYEAAVDFDVEVSDGSMVRVLMPGARVFLRAPRLRPAPPALARDLFDRVPSTGAERPDAYVRAGERLLTDGDVVEIAGFKTTVVDPSTERLHRDTAFVPAACSAAAPLVVFAVQMHR